jgi:hypothetical protein
MTRALLNPQAREHLCKLLGMLGKAYSALPSGTL